MSHAVLPPASIDRVVRLALEEDVAFGDVTTEAFVAEEAQAEALLRAREPGVLCGGEVLARTLTTLDDDVVVDSYLPDGAAFSAGTELARITGPARAILTGERVALNLVQRLSGVASLTSQVVAAVEGSGARITDTRKTTPGLRRLERYAVRCGGGNNHRFNLSDAVLAKDNHLVALRNCGTGLAEAIAQARSRLPHTTHIEVEVDQLAQIPEAIHGAADSIMLDNFTLEDLRRGVEMIAGRTVVEASGRVTLQTVAQIASTGVDVISVGALTHSAPALDLGLDFRISR